MSERKAKHVMFEFDTTSSAQGAKCATCGKYSTNFFWINGVAYCAEHAPQHVSPLDQSDILAVMSMRAELVTLRAAAHEQAARADAYRALLVQFQDISTRLSNAEGELADHLDSGGEEDDPDGIRIRGVIYKSRRELVNGIFASRVVTAPDTGAERGDHDGK